MMDSNLLTYCVITPFYPTLDKFYGVYIYDQVKALIRTGQKVIVLRPFDLLFDHNISDYEYEGTVVKYFPVIHTPSNILNGITDQINSVLFRNFISKCIIGDFNLQFIHCHTLDCALYGLELKKKFPNAKTILQHHDLDPYMLLNGRFAEKSWNINYKAKKAVKKFSAFDVHVSVSKRVEENLLAFPQKAAREHYSKYIDRLEKLSSKLHKANIKRSIVLYNGVDFSKFYKIPKRKNKQDHSYRIGCVGNYISIKNHKLLIDAVCVLVKKGYTHIKLQLVGNNPRSEYLYLRQYVQDKHLQQFVEFLPPFRHSELVVFYNSIDLFVLPSQFEGLGCVYLEAFACGTPFIGVRDQGIDDLIPNNDKDKWLLSRIDVNELSQKIETAMLERSQQVLVENINIDFLIESFLNKL